jgi:multidrug resistance efflux pump
MRSILLLALALTGCADKAKPDYDKCVLLEGRDELMGAIDACRAAVRADPTSKAGTAASSKIAVLEATFDRRKVEAAANQAAKEQAAREAERLAQLRNTVSFTSLSHIEANTGAAVCRPEGKPPVWAGCRSSADQDAPGDATACEAVARASGCELEAKGHTWCCPRGVLGLP